MKKHGHYCKVCGEYKANEKFSGKGHAAHICKKCAALPPDVRSTQMIENKLLSLPWRLSKEQVKWLHNKANALQFQNHSYFESSVCLFWMKPSH